MQYQAVQVELAIGTSKVVGKDKAEVSAYLRETVLPMLLESLTNKARGG